MKTIVLLRHAKSDWDAAYDGDHARPLAERGRKGARKMGRFLTTARLLPDRALASTAVRARETLAIAAEAGGWSGPARITDALYSATPEGVLHEIQAEPDDAEVLVVVGHEPTQSGLASLLVGGGRIEMKTAAVAQIDVDVDRWADVRPGQGALALLLPPSALRPNAYRKLKKQVDKALKAQAEAAEAAERTAAPPAPPPGATARPDPASPA